MDARSLPDFKVLPYPARSLESDHNDLSTPLQEPITLNTSSSWTYCGPLLTLDPRQLPSSFHTWSQATVNGSLLIPLFSFLAFVHEFLETNGLAHYWITIRASKASHEFDAPRWHTDDLFFLPLAQAVPSQPRWSLLSPFSSGGKHPWREANLRRKMPIKANKSTERIQVTTTNPNPTNWKLTTALLGPGTLFIAQKTGPLARKLQRNAKLAARAANPNHICLSIRCVGCAMAAESVRTRLAADLGHHSIVQAQRGECVFFRVGEEDGAVHSEPRSHGDRVFVNVVPGHEADLMSLMAKWGMEYPRAWCVGLPFQVAEEAQLRNVGEM